MGSLRNLHSDCCDLWGCGYDSISRAEVRDMNGVLAMVAILINKVAEMGAGFLSMGALYQPEIPEELKK